VNLSKPESERVGYVRVHPEGGGSIGSCTPKVHLPTRSFGVPNIDDIVSVRLVLRVGKDRTEILGREVDVVRSQARLQGEELVTVVNVVASDALAGVRVGVGDDLAIPPSQAIHNFRGRIAEVRGRACLESKVGVVAIEQFDVHDNLRVGTSANSTANGLGSIGKPGVGIVSGKGMNTIWVGCVR